MKKFTRFTLSSALSMSLLLSANAQELLYQIPNSNFEEWETMGSFIKFSEPLYWNSFKTATGGLAGAAANQLEKSTDIREGATGSSAYIFSKNILGKKANGNLTTGQINMGDMNPQNAANYNFTNLDNAAHNRPFNGKPDSVKVWIKFIPVNADDLGQVSIWLHDRFAMKEPHASAADIKNHAVAQALVQPTKTDGWKEIIFPFDYAIGESVDPQYILVSFSTNKTAGEGSGGDKLYIDDLSFVYNSKLDSIHIGGATFKGFDKNVFEYENIYKNADFSIPEIEVFVDGAGATYEQTTGIDDDQVLITVTSHDKLEQHRYTLNFVSPPVGLDEIESQSLNIYASNGGLFIGGNTQQLPVSVFNIQGQLIGQFDGKQNVIYPALVPGTLYIVKVGNQATRVLF